MAWKAISSLILVSLLAFTIQILLFSPISPDLLVLPTQSPFISNNKLQEVIKVGEGFVKGPEDVAIDKEGTIYTATRDGWIKKLHKNGSIEDWKFLDSPSLIGITLTKEGDIIACDSEQGLLKVNENGVTVLTSHLNGSKIRFADDVIEASDGSLYFSVASTKFGFHEWYLDVLEAKPHGQLLKYEPLSGDTSVVLDHLGFANGVALSKDQDYLVICETWRCLKYWVEGVMKGKTEVLIENLPGGPDNINLARDGSFWIALLQLYPKELEFVHTSKIIKKTIAIFPKLIGLLLDGLSRKAVVVNVAADGKIIKFLDDFDGKVINFVTNAIEFEDFLYLGSLTSDFIGKLPL